MHSKQGIFIAGIILIIACLSFGPIYAFYLVSNSSTIQDKIMQGILGLPEVKCASILYDEDFFELSIEIFLTNGGRLLLGKVNEWSSGDIIIYRVGDFEFFGFGYKLRPDFLGFMIKEKIKTVKDIIVHYDKIYALIISWPNLSELKESKDETVSQIFNRRPDLFVPIYFKGKKYVFAITRWDDNSFRMWGDVSD